MTGAMYAAVSGMRAHMNKLNVISNNVANVNTYGYKSAQMSFQDAMYTTSRAGSNGSALTGGTNPSQIGYGVEVATIDLDMSAKNFIPTGIGTDCMITGDGFFMVGDKLENYNGVVDPSSLTLTRVGQFHFDPDGYLVDPSGAVVYGFLTCATSDGDGTIDADGTGQYAGVTGQTPGVSTKLVPIRLPMAAKAPGVGGADGTIKTGEAIYPSVATDGVMADPKADNSSGKCVSLNSVSISKDGKITGVNQSTGDVVVVGYVPLASVANPAGVTHMGGRYYKALDGAGDTMVSSIGNIVKGNLNNKTADVASALENITGTGKTELATNGLESSGTDVATEFSEMITTQRGYQANTRIITVTDTMLEELVNLKR